MTADEPRPRVDGRRSGGRSSPLQTILLGAAALTPWLDGVWGAIALAVLTGAWFRLRSGRPGVGLVGIPLGVATLVLALGHLSPDLDGAADARLQEHARRGWSDLWAELDRTAAVALRSLPNDISTSEDRLLAFESLDEVARASSSGSTLMLIDPDGEPVAWAGPGLLHDLVAETLPADGRTHRAGFTAVTLLRVRAVGELSPGWQLVAGFSHRNDQLPFAMPWHRQGLEVDWSVTPAGAAVDGNEVLSIELDDTPGLQIDAAVRRPEGAGWIDRSMAGRLAWALIGLALISFGVSRSVRATLFGDRPSVVDLAISGAGGAMSWALSGGLAPALAVILGAAVAITAAGLLRVGARPVSWALSFAGSALAVALAVALPRLATWQRSPLDLGSYLVAPGEVIAVRLALFGIALGLLGGLRGRCRSEVGGGWLTAAFTLLIAAAVSHDTWQLALPALGIGGALLGLWSAGNERLQRPTTLAVLALGASLIASTGWEIGHRVLLKRHLDSVVLPQMAPPTAEEIVALSAQLDHFFNEAEVNHLTLGSPTDLEARDLAYALWRRSPLARRDALSALVVTPVEMNASTFSFGLPPLRDGLAEWSPEQWRQLSLPGWQGNLIQGEAILRLRGRPWATVSYWLLLRPGFRLGMAGTTGLAVDLLRGDPTTRAPAAEAIQPARFALYDASGRPLIVPWTETPVLFLGEGEEPSSITPTPEGRAWTFGRWAQDGIEVIYLDLLGPVAAFERVGNQVVSVMAVLAVLMFVALVLALPRAAVRSLLGRTLRSYSKRLLIVYTGLLLVPLLLLNIVLLGQFESRLERQNKSAGEAGLDTAQRILGDYLLTLTPGFGIDTALDEELWQWLSRVTGHEVNLYWSGTAYASSRQALFTAGILPKRIPGEIYSRLSLLGYRLATRTNRVDDTGYLEMYAPLRVPGAPAQERLFLSLPLLAQQEEVAAEIARLRNAAMLVTSLLFALLVVVGNRLAHRFTQPLRELVEGTKRIAEGASSLDLTPSDLELSALVEAVDSMAHRIDEGRSNLLREKQVVEVMVDNIASAVVSVDEVGRVLIHNRVATALLGVKEGDDLLSTLRGADDLQRVAGFVAATDAATTHSATVRLAAPGGAEKEWSLNWIPLPGGTDPAALFVVEDVTVALRAQRLHAWEEMARMIAHEVKNPLTPIQLSTEHMQEVWSRSRHDFEPVFDSCTTNILRQVETLREIADEFSTYSSVARFDPQPEDLVAHLRTIGDSYSAAATRGIQVAFESDCDRLELRFDSRLLGRAVRNLMENAIRVAPTSGEVFLRLAADADEARITVADTGPGVPPESLSRIFDPNFSTRPGGTGGLGLPIARRVVEQHGGTISADHRRGGGLEVLIRLPLESSPDRAPAVDDAE